MLSTVLHDDHEGKNAVTLEYHVVSAIDRITRTGKQQYLYHELLSHQFYWLLNEWGKQSYDIRNPSFFSAIDRYTWKGKQQYARGTPLLSVRLNVIKERRKKKCDIRTPYNKPLYTIGETAICFQEPLSYQFDGM